MTLTFRLYELTIGIPITPTVKKNHINFGFESAAYSTALGASQDHIDHTMRTLLTD